ncbi:MAG: hypothetical protein ACLQDY_07130 [Streptosporangiaceae bacterium]
MLVEDEVVLRVGFPAARAELENPADSGVLLGACEDAYGAGITGLALAGAVAMSRLAGLCCGKVSGTQDGVRLALRWEAIDPSGELFPGRGADLMLTRAGEQATVLALAGAYRQPPGLAAAGFEQAIWCRFAAATIRRFMARLACALVHPEGSAEPTCLAGSWRFAVAAGA